MADNLYKAPQSNLEPDIDKSSVELADRANRFLAALIDGIIGLVLAIPFFMYAAPLLGFELGQEANLQFSLLSSLYGFITFCLVQGYFLHINGQTIGKRLNGIKIVSTSYANVSAAHILGKRYLPISFVSVLPIIGQILPLIDILFIFRKDRRCLHDLIAGTCVIKV